MMWFKTLKNQCDGQEGSGPRCRDTEALRASLSNRLYLFPEWVVDSVFWLLVQWSLGNKIVSSTWEAQSS